MKKLLIISLMCFSSLSTVGCAIENKNNNIIDKNSNVSSSSSSTIMSSSSSKKNLEEGVDYIDHSITYDGHSFEYDETMWYINELKDVPLPDPHVYEEDGVYYITGTSDRTVGKVVDCYVTEDFVSYERYEIYSPNKYNGWENDDSPEIYAPEIYKFGDKYYMYYSANDSISPKSVRRNSVVVADNPIGPYKPIQTGKIDGLNEPIFNFDKARGLDITIFEDDDGQLYMYYVTTESTQHIVGVKLKSPYEADWTTRKALIMPGTKDTNSSEIELEWEIYRDNSLEIAEAPFMIKSDDKYYLTYSVNGCWNKYYNVCYAVSDSPLGDYTKPYEKGKLWTNLLLGYPSTNDPEDKVYQQWSGFASGTGHHCFFYIGDQLMVGYHAHQNRDYDESKSGYVKRYFAFDYVYFDDDGVPFCNGPTYSLQPLPEELSGYKNIAENAKVNRANLINENAVNDNYIVDCYNLDNEENKEVILGKGKSYIELEFDNEYEIGGIAIYNSAYYEKYIYEIEYIDFGNGNILYYPQFSVDGYVNDKKEFIYPCSAFTLEFKNTIFAEKVTLCFDLPNGGSINEIKVLGQ